jgi:saccharopine dehydrogenase-like NADP-dependent oxidoreductase
MRFGGFCEVVTAWKEMGLMNDTPDESLAKGAKEITWVELTAKLLGTKADEE